MDDIQFSEMMTSLSSIINSLSYIANHQHAIMDLSIAGQTSIENLASRGQIVSFFKPIIHSSNIDPLQGDFGSAGSAMKCCQSFGSLFITPERIQSVPETLSAQGNNLSQMHGVVIFFTSGTGPYGGSVTVQNTTKHVDANSTPGGCASVTWQAAVGAGLQARLEGGDGVRMYGMGLVVTVVGATITKSDF